MDIKDLWPSDIAKIGAWDRVHSENDFLNLYEAACFLADSHPALTPSNAQQRAIDGFHSLLTQSLEYRGGDYFLCGALALKSNGVGIEKIEFSKSTYWEWHCQNKQGTLPNSWRGEVLKTSNKIGVDIQRLYANRRYLTVREFIICSLGLPMGEYWTEEQEANYRAFEQLFKDHIDLSDIPF